MPTAEKFAVIQPVLVSLWDDQVDQGILARDLFGGSASANPEVGEILWETFEYEVVPPPYPYPWYGDRKWMRDYCLVRASATVERLATDGG